MQNEDRPLIRFRAGAPFKVRLLRLDPTSTFETLIEQEKIAAELIKIPEGPHKGKTAVGVKLAKPTPWYKKLI